MTPQLEKALELARLLMAPWQTSFATPAPDRLDVCMPAEDLLHAVQLLTEARWGYLSTITGLDLAPAENALELLYHFSHGAAVLTLRVKLPHESPVVASIDRFAFIASVYEREIREMLGVEFIGMRDTSRLFLPDEWPQGQYPLRKAWNRAALQVAAQPQGE